MAQPLMQTVSLSVSHLGLTTVVGPSLIASLTFAEAGLEAPIASPFFKPAEDEEEPPEPVTIQACPWLPPQLPVAQRLIRLALRAAHEALDAHLEGQEEGAPRPGVWLVVPAERPGFTKAALDELSEAIWRELRPRDVRVFTDETGTMQAIQDIAQTLRVGASALLLAVDSYFCEEIAERLIAEPVTPWEPTPPTPSEAAAAVLFTGKGSLKAGFSAGRSSAVGSCQPPVPTPYVARERAEDQALKGSAGAVPSNPPQDENPMRPATVPFSADTSPFRYVDALDGVFPSEDENPMRPATVVASADTSPFRCMDALGGVFPPEDEDPMRPATVPFGADTSPFRYVDALDGVFPSEDEGPMALVSSPVSQVYALDGESPTEDEGPMSTALVSSRLASTALGAEGSSGIARVICAGATMGLATESNDELQDGLAMTVLLEGLSQAVLPEVVLGPSQISPFLSREWEMATCRAPSKLARGHRELDVSGLFGWVGAASTTVALVYAIAATRLGLLEPQDGSWLTAAVWSLAPSGARGLLGVMTEAQGS